MLTFAAISGTILAVIINVSNPFSPAFTVGQGLGPAVVLEDWEMVIRSPMLFAGYAALAVVFGAAMGDPNDPMRSGLLARWSRLAWTFLTVGLACGALWAYGKAEFAGYWNWGTSENASLVPWLATAAMVHYTADARQASGRTATLLAGAGFASTLPAAYLARSGAMVGSHVFVGSAPAAVLVLAIVVILVATGLRIRNMPRAWHAGSGSQKVAMAVIALVTTAVLACAFWPIWGKAFVEVPPAVQTRVYNGVIGWLGVVALISLLWCSIRTATDRTRGRLECMLSSTTVASTVCFCLWYFANLSIAKLLAGWVAAAVVVTLVFEFFSSPSHGDRRSALARRVGHLAVVLVVFGVIGSISTDRHAVQVPLSVGQSRTVPGLRITLEDIDRSHGNETSKVTATVTVKTRLGEDTLFPGYVIYPDGTKRIEIDFSTGWLHDIYTVLEGYDENKAIIRVRENWLVSWVWAGLALFVVAGLISTRRFMVSGPQVRPSQRDKNNHRPATADGDNQ